MGTTRASKVKLLTAIGLLASSAALRQEPEEVDLFAKQRILTAIGPGLRAVRQGANGRLYVLASAAPGLVVVDAAGKQLLAIGEEPAATGSAAATHSLITFGEDCDVDAEGGRSEEHTSELQSLRHLVCRLLLEKKNRRVSVSWTR